ncbi:kynurenine aminotransferase-like isoform X2 [Tenebrio molitor]|uniref:kynurenine aminotransferase-like isoform X2 n=1 Tax=Tenebrio molitor TaxID=7067 RepID=UPI0036249CC7
MCEIEDKFKLPAPFSSKEKPVWEEYAQLAEDHNALDLGQGFPDYSPPTGIAEILAEVALSNNSLIHQYTRDYGHPRLVSTLSKLYTPLIGREINPQTEILITIGSQEALFSSIMGHVDVGEEVVVFEPFSPWYKSMVKAAGGVLRTVPLKLKKTAGQVMTSEDWIFDKSELEGVFNIKTKMLILNNPHSPLGKVFKLEELEQIAELCKKWNVLCVAEEVYEWVVYKPNKHIRIASLQNMWERTITIGSTGGTLSLTGWQVGWVYGPTKLIHNLMIVHQQSVYTGTTPLQEVVATVLEKELAQLGQNDCYFNSLPTELDAKRLFLAKVLTDVGMKPIIPQGGYSMVVDWSPLESRIDLSTETDKWKDCRFIKWMTKNLGLQGIPLTPFYPESGKSLGENFVQYCFFKKDATLEKAAQILTDWKIKL